MGIELDHGTVPGDNAVPGGLVPIADSQNLHQY